jgi:CelD/BcsL family acetyltransferase involved in cellulose biosynthesis
LKQLEKLDYKVIWNNVVDFDRLVELNKKRFGDDSNYFQPGFEDGMKRLIKVADKKLQMVSIKVDKVIEAVEIGVLYNKVYYVLDGGANIKIANIGKLLIVEHIKRAISLGAVKVDFLSSDSGWKKLWNLDETKQWEWCNFEE